MRCDLDVTGGFQFQLPGDEFGRRRMADGDENAVGSVFGHSAALEIFQAYMSDLCGILGAADFIDLAVPDHLDLGMLEQPVLQDAFGAQAVAAMHQRHRGREVGEEQRFLDGGVTAADHEDILVAIEEAVAGGAGGDAEALEFLFRRNAEPTRLRAGDRITLSAR